MAKINIRKFLLAAAALSAVSLGSLAAITAPAAARTVCDRDGDDCYYSRPAYYDRDWHERHEWRERREREEAYRRWYWHRMHRWDRPYGESSVWLNF